ncbi:MAG: hypothetical protein COY58_02930 [Gammaproteobacteria bacterium CG_4_10_14_0_8_um_filter_38_16]|nr:MAG: hypothetical protein COY58_02930 [Gammaproteobacteria bacterium CG_4_10_14_0_8_um_filter_38_16]PJA03882.1 MAG: hypothetical protein COX72_03090 [Gammaproteobacteria bacterium CG_4_10_14_0_2_um_filter_38_22]PJB09504.1 MAG: hypothetical protein CO120_09715 [Gammaproteobacteria bacterium CG_4_9_14_3_um_filter_38_9]
MHYWNAVLDEVLHKDEDVHAFFFTNRGRLDELLAIPASPPIKTSNPYKKRTYYLGDRFPSVYLTRREAEAMFWIIQDYTFARAAHKMNLSPRTVEFYVKNLKLKLQCRTKKELVEKIIQTDLLQQLESEDHRIVWH